ncbi:unnamed protein product [Diabrotica balteata]|uniref:Uncharacterized protein n=1 Tax=Diabrotica balteata TaxID=107213 RepID=A0A9N9SNM6_DIABA|nr:unnamed protein product [Diabrotica balteata]
MDYSEEKPQSAKEKFEISGIITSAAFQRCRFLAIKLYRSFPKQYEHPVIKPMLNVEWEQFLTKMQRTFGNGIWALKKPVIAFVNEQFIGDDKAFVNHLIKKYHFSLNLDLDQIGKCHLVEFLREKMGKYRQITYFTIAINNQVIGTMMFESITTRRRSLKSYRESSHLLRIPNFTNNYCYEWRNNLRRNSRLLYLDGKARIPKYLTIAL